MSTTSEFQEVKRFKTYDPQIRFSSIVVQKFYDAAHRIYLGKTVKIKDPRKQKHKDWEAMPEGEAKEQAFEDLIREKTIEISQVYDDNENALNDYKYAKEAARVLDAEYFGPNDEWDLNPDPENESISEEKYNKVLHQYADIKKELTANPTVKYMGFVFVSARGMDKDSRQNIILNEYDKKTKFYKTVDLEYSLQFIARKCKNVYLIGVFGCGRRVFDPKRHTGFLSKEEAFLKYEIFNRILGIVEKKQEEKKEEEILSIQEGLLKQKTSVGGILKKKTSVAQVQPGKEKYDDKIIKFTLVYCCRKENTESWGKYSLSNTKILYEFTQCLLRNCIPQTLEVDFPIVLNDIRGEKVEEIEIINSVIMLPKTRIDIRGNRMVGAGLNQQKSSGPANNSSDIIANFHSNSEMSKIDLASIFSDIDALFQSGDFDQLEQVTDKHFKKSEEKDDKYPDVFVQLFKSLADDYLENEDHFKILLMVTCKAGLEQRIELFKTLLCNSAPGASSKTPMQKDRFIEIFEKLFTLCSVGILKEIMSSNYLEQIEKYRDDELGEIEASANASAADFADDVFQSEEEVPFSKFFEKIHSLRIHWIFVPHQVCVKLVNDANVISRHISKREATREVTRLKQLVKKAKEMRKKQEMEDAKNTAADLAVNKMMQGGEFNKILEDIENAAKNKKLDKFAEKYALLVCNEIYATKAGLDNLPQTKNDLNDVKRTIKMLNIKDKNTIVLVDTNHKEIEFEFETLMDKVVAQVCKLNNPTGIGSNLKFQSGGVVWLRLMPIVFDLIDKGVLQKTEREIGQQKIQSVDLSDFNEIEFKLTDKDQKILQILIDAQKCVDERDGLIEEKEAKIFRGKKILSMNWERYKETAMKPEKGRDSIIVVLRPHEKVLLQRYIENELKCRSERGKENFITCKGYSPIQDEVLLFAYFAGHGCADTFQYYVLNEDHVDKCFWKAESHLQRLAKMAGPSFKQFVVFDTCREPLNIPRDKVIEYHAKLETKKSIRSGKSLEEVKEISVSPKKSNRKEEQKSIPAKKEETKKEETKKEEPKTEAKKEEPKQENTQAPTEAARGTVQKTQKKEDKSDRWNYYAIYGTTAASTVKAESQLANELHHILVQKSANLLGEVVCPRDFELMRGYDGKTTKNNITSEFSFSFGANQKFGSGYDLAATKLYEALGNKQNDVDLIEEITEYFDKSLKQDDKLVWMMAKRNDQALKEEMAKTSPREGQEDSGEQDAYTVLDAIDFSQGTPIMRAMRQWILTQFIKQYQAQNETFTIAVFGECGQGKSTLLSKISEVYREKYNQNDSYCLKFDASPSLMSVTSVVKIAKSGNMTLIDSPGFNDPNKARTDKAIFMDLINTIREPLKSPEQGITMFIQCIMPDKSDRIRQSVINSMMNFLLILSVFHKDTKVSDLKACHPQMAIVFNNVSKQQDVKYAFKRIEAYKQLLAKEATEFYCDEVSDDTMITGAKDENDNPQTWKVLKTKVMNDENFQQQPWFQNLTDYEKELIKSLKVAQEQYATEKGILNPVSDPRRRKEIEDKIDALFIFDRFYFYKANPNAIEEESNQKVEEEEIQRLISDCFLSTRCYLQKGNLETLHHMKTEREIIVDQMSSLLIRATSEMKQQVATMQTMLEEEELAKIKVGLGRLESLRDDFDVISKQRPWALQKISLQGIVLVKECIQRVKTESLKLLSKSYERKISKQREANIKNLEVMEQQQNQIERDGQDNLDDGPVNADTMGPHGGARVSVLDPTAGKSKEKTEPTTIEEGKTQGGLDEHESTDKPKNIETKEYKSMEDLITQLKKENKVLKAFEKGVKQGLQQALSKVQKENK